MFLTWVDRYGLLDECLFSVSTVPNKGKLLARTNAEYLDTCSINPKIGVGNFFQKNLLLIRTANLSQLLPVGRTNHQQEPNNTLLVNGS